MTKEELEKEAEDNKPPYAFCSLNTNCELWKDGFQKGAEFGYNKANEWHYVKDGDLPPEDTKVLALMSDKEICIAHFYRRNVWDKIGTVVAWKEIVLPELKESE
jgi:hypothetical protein